MSDEVGVKTNESALHAPPEIKSWAKRITDAQGCAGVLSREANGYHLAIPCPECLHTHKQREVDEPKYSINLSMLAGVGEQFQKVKKNIFLPTTIMDALNQGKKNEYGSSICMRTRSSRSPHRFPIQDLLNMSTVESRHPDIRTNAGVSGKVGGADRESFWIEDEKTGVMCPPPPGEGIKLSDLPDDHPAIDYLRRRNYDIKDLEKQFRCIFCTKEFPHGEKNIFYRRMPGGWRDTPQNRVIFYSIIDGVPMTWQARVIEKENDYIKYMLHPYAGGYFPTKDAARVERDTRRGGLSGEFQCIPDGEGSWGYLWSRTHTRANPSSPWMPIAPFDELTSTGGAKFKPSKYRTAKHSARSIMGWDAAMQKTVSSGEDHPWVVLCEGPLDAARVGPGGLAILGSSLSQDNAAKIASNFHIVFSAFDSDRAGREATAKINKTLMEAKHRAPVLLGVLQLQIPSGKDLGSMTPAQFQITLSRAKKAFLRGS